LRTYFFAKTRATLEKSLWHNYTIATAKQKKLKCIVIVTLKL